MANLTIRFVLLLQLLLVASCRPIDQVALSSPPYMLSRAPNNNYNHNLLHQESANFSRRWFSVAERPAVMPQDPGDLRFPWPVTCEDQAWVYFCFSDAHSALNLLPILKHAIAKWARAFQMSSLSVQPDPACNGDYFCVCAADGLGHDTNPLSLVITDNSAAGTQKTSGPYEVVTMTVYWSQRSVLMLSRIEL